MTEHELNWEPALELELELELSLLFWFFGLEVWIEPIIVVGYIEEMSVRARR